MHTANHAREGHKPPLARLPTLKTGLDAFNKTKDDGILKEETDESGQISSSSSCSSMQLDWASSVGGPALGGPTSAVRALNLLLRALSNTLSNYL